MKRPHFLALAGAAAATQLPLRARAQDVATIKIGNLKITSDAPFWLADRFGYFRDEGIKVEFTTFNSGEAMMVLLANGQLHVASASAGASLYNAVIHGDDLRAVADTSSVPPGYGSVKLMVRTELVKSGKFKTIADLKGMTIAGAAVASSSAVQVSRLLAKAGLQFNDVKRVALPYPQHVVALKNGAIDASLTVEPFATLVEDSGAAVKIAGNDQFYPNQEVSVLLYSGIFVKTNRDLGVRFMRAYIKGVRYYNDSLANGKIAGRNAGIVLNLLAEQTGAPRSLFERATPIAMNPNGHVFRPSMREDLGFYRSQGFIEGEITTDRVVDDTFVNAALRKLGGYKRAV